MVVLAELPPAGGKATAVSTTLPTNPMALVTAA
jgi:hypothetical protein